MTGCDQAAAHSRPSPGELTATAGLRCMAPMRSQFQLYKRSKESIFGKGP